MQLVRLIFSWFLTNFCSNHRFWKQSQSEKSCVGNMALEYIDSLSLMDISIHQSSYIKNDMNILTNSSEHIHEKWHEYRKQQFTPTSIKSTDRQLVSIYQVNFKKCGFQCSWNDSFGSHVLNECLNSSSPTSIKFTNDHRSIWFHLNFKKISRMMCHTMSL